jgi:ferredoxin
MRVTVDLELCEGHGECCIAAPEVFRLDDDDVLSWQVQPDETLRPEVRQAVSVCPTQAISIEG